MSEIIELDRTNFDQEVRRASMPVVVEFVTNWCEFCEELEPVVEELAEDYDGTIKVARVAVDEHGRLANDYHIADVPTFLAFHRGNILQRKAGELTADDVEAMFGYLTDLPRVSA
ncbi:MAG: thioredoxin family protein [Bradymonadaceae bacterium]